jgi:hypothetical protein
MFGLNLRHLVVLVQTLPEFIKGEQTNRSFAGAPEAKASGYSISKPHE